MVARAPTDRVGPGGIPVVDPRLRLLGHRAGIPPAEDILDVCPRVHTSITKEYNHEETVRTFLNFRKRRTLRV